MYVIKLMSISNIIIYRTYKILTDPDNNINLIHFNI